jgi:transcriptional regulator with XRE-family HTH domain
MSDAPINGGDTQDLGAVLAILRTARRWHQRDLADACGLHASTLSGYERGTIRPGLAILEKLLAVLGYPWAAFDLTRAFLKTLQAASLAAAEMGGNGTGAVATVSAVELALGPRPVHLQFALILKIMERPSGSPEEPGGGEVVQFT